MKRMNTGLKKIISLLICLICVCGISVTGFAAEKGSLDLQMFEKTVKLDMPKNTASFWFLLPDGTVVDDQSYMNLDMKFSETLIYERSSITLEINGNVIETKWIMDIQDKTVCTWKVQIPQEVLKIGELNELKITTTQRSIEGDCADIDNPSNWVSLLSTSYLHVSITEKASPKLSNLYSFFYENPADKGTLETEFIIPEQADGVVKSSMLKAASAVGSYYPYNDKLIYSVSEKEVSEDGEHKIALGYDDALEAGSGSITVEDNGSYYKANITGKDEEGLKKAVAFFSSNEFMKQISRNSVVVTSDIRNRIINQEFKKNEAGYYQFSDFGYDTITLAGAFHQSTRLTFRQPGGVRSGDDSYVLIRFRHSKALEADRSLMTVYCDDEALDSVKLSSSNADYGELKVKIPVEYLKEDVIHLNIDCYNYLGKIDCSKDYYDTAWTVIDKSSNIYFEPGNIGVTPTLYNTPAFNNLTFNSTVVMSLADETTKAQLEMATALATRTGQNSQIAPDFMVVNGIDGLSEELLNQDIFMIASNDQFTAPEKVIEQMSIVPKGGNTFEINTAFMVSAETLVDKIVFQVIRSPWNFDKKIYILTYDPAVEKEILPIISDKKVFSLLSGQIALINTDKKVTTYTFAEEEKEEKVPVTWERIKYLIESNTGFSVWIVFGAFILIIIAIIVMIRVISNKMRFKKAAANMVKLNEQEAEEMRKVRELEEKNEEVVEDVADDYNNDEVAYKYDDYGDSYPDDEE